MRAKFLWAWFIGCVWAVTCCAYSPVGPINPPAPPEPPIVVVPPNPQPPVPVDNVVPYLTSHAIVKGMTRDAVEQSIGFPPGLVTPQDDGTTITRYAAEGEIGTPRWLDIVYSSNGRVLGHSLVPRIL